MHNRYKVVSLKELEADRRVSETGPPLWSIDSGELILGHYLLTGRSIIAESLHENFDESWLRYWTTKRGHTFGGASATDLKIEDRGKYLLSNTPLTAKKFVDSEVYLFQYTYDHNFYHFLMTALPRIQYFLSESFRGVKLLVRERTPDYQLELIRYLVPEDRWLRVQEEVHYQFPKVWISGFPQSYGLEFVDSFYSALDFRSAAPTRLNCQAIYLSRDDEPNKRPLKNSSELAELMREFGLEETVMSDISLPERISLLKNVSVIAGVFSAGFANLVFARKCKVAIYIEHPIYLVPWEIVRLCELRGTRLLVVSHSAIKRSLYKAIAALHRSRSRSSLSNATDSIPWAINQRKVRRLMKKVFREELKS